MKVLYVASEARPFIASGGLADVAGSLPQALRQRLIGCRIVLPMYEGIPQEMKDKLEFITSFSVPVAWRRQYCGVFQAKIDNVIYYLLDNQYYFKRQGLYGHYDDAERFAFFSRAVIEMIPYIDFKPDIIHCNDWQSALTPVFYNLFYANREGFQGIKTVFTIHNIQYQGKYGTELLEDVIGIPNDAVHVLMYDGDVNFMKGAIECADQITTVSPSYAQEILDPWYSHGLDGILRDRSWKLMGILNGIDTVYNDPNTDKDIYANYNSEDLSGKAYNKSELQKEFNLPVEPDVPLIGMVSRLVSHKGLDLVKSILGEILEYFNVQFVVLGSGDWQYEKFFQEMAERYPHKLGLRIGFIPSLSKKVYAGSDMFLMPSKSEPCGLSQMIALRYGSIPIVRATGGLKDSISDSGDEHGNGFVFINYNAHEMKYAIERAINGYKNKDGWKILTKRSMESDNSWGASANQYIKMYKNLLK